MAQNSENYRDFSKLNRSVTMAVKNKKAKRVSKPKLLLNGRQEATKVTNRLWANVSMHIPHVQGRDGGVRH